MSVISCHMSCVTCHMSHVMCHMFVLDKVVKLVSGGSVINGAYPVWFIHVTQVIVSVLPNLFDLFYWFSALLIFLSNGFPPLLGFLS